MKDSQGSECRLACKAYRAIWNPMGRTRTKAEKIATASVTLGILIAIGMPMLSVPFKVPYPVWALTPLENAVYLFLLSVTVLLVGGPASIITICRKRGRGGWLYLLGCLAIGPIGVAAIYAVAFMLGESITVH